MLVRSFARSAAGAQSSLDHDRHGAINLFCDNLRAYLEGGPLQNVIDWERGY
jgi:hypothetical protein